MFLKGHGKDVLDRNLMIFKDRSNDNTISLSKGIFIRLLKFDESCFDLIYRYRLEDIINRVDEGDLIGIESLKDNEDDSTTSIF